VTDKQVDIPTVITREERIEEQLEQEDYINDEPERKSYRNVWKVILLLVAIISLSLVAIYQYFPTAFDYFKGKQQAPIGGLSPAAKQAAKAAVKPDTAIKVSAANTAPTVLPTNVIDSTKSRFELMAGSFKTRKASDLAISNYKSLGIVAKVVTDAPGKRIKISIGTFATEKEAVDARIELIKTKKVNRDIYPLEIKPKK
jgi:hypothetical protein